MPRQLDPLVVAAARDNAAWCAAMCTAHGIASSVHAGVWAAHSPTPDGYPEAVTLVPGRSPEHVAAVLPAGATSVKDSFADVDLGDAGFRVLFDAAWIARSPSLPHDRGAAVMRIVRTSDDLAAWASAHGGGDVFAPALLEDPSVVVLASGDPIAAGAVVTDAGEVIGVSNVFGAPSAYSGVVRWAETRPASRTMVGWEAGDDLAAATAAGFHTIGDLRVWTLTE